ncbi:integrase catalytic domain-containing protein [Trichonephila clavipes]|nr:integrase catalytic domain-containing protein [Trichonephila clavipes]
MRDDPALHERDQAIEIFKETVEFQKGRYIVQLPFRKSCNELSDNDPLAKQRFQNLWRKFCHDSELYQQQREIIRDYREQVYRFNRVNFGVSSSPFLLEATIRHHIENYKHEFPDTVELLDRSFYVDDLISGGNEFEEALQTSRRAKNIMEAARMDLRKWITNDANLMEQWKKENFNVHPVHETVSLGANGTKVLGLSWNTNEDFLTTDTKKEIQWDDPLPTHIEKEWKKWCDELPHLRNLKIPRLVLDSTLLEEDVELHSFCDASKKTYSAAIYLRTKSRNGISVKIVTSKTRAAPLNCVTQPRLELLGARVTARLASKVKRS